MKAEREFQTDIVRLRAGFVPFAELFADKARNRYELVNRVKPRPMVEEQDFYQAVVRSGMVTREKGNLGNCQGEIVWLEREILGHELMADLVEGLGQGEGLWIMNQAVLEEEERAELLDRMKACQLVNRKVVRLRGENWTMAYGRKELKRGKSGERYDLTEYWPVRKALDEMVEGYRSQGWQVDASQAINSCKYSWSPRVRGNPIVEGAELGFGVRLTAPCGCSWEIDKKGVLKRIKICQADCDGLPLEGADFGERELLNSHNPMNVLGRDIPVAILGMKNGGGLLTDRIVEKIIKTKRGAVAEILVNLRHPQEGLKGVWKRRVPVDNLVVWENGRYRKYKV